MRGYALGHNIRIQHPLKDLIYAKGMTIKECAERSELNVYTIQNIIARRNIPKRDTVQRIADTLQLPVAKIQEVICQH